METLHLRNASIPRLGFGTWQMKGRECREAVATAIQTGYRHIDTAQMYDNEADVGLGVSDANVPREDLWITTKLGLEQLGSPNVVRSTEHSLRRLGCDYVDLLLIHWPSRDVPLAETIEAMRSLVDRRVVRHLGVSNFTPSLLKKAAELSPLLTNQVEYHPYLNQSAMLDLCQKQGIALTAYSPLAKGRVPEDEGFSRIGRKYGKTAAQVVLRWLMQQPSVMAVPKSSKRERIEENLDVFDFELSPDDMRRISERRGGQRLIDPDWAPAWGT